MLREAMNSLEARLRQAATADNWQEAVVHRCAWCKRIASLDGTYQTARSSNVTRIMTDGMCPACAAAGRATIALRSRPTLLAA
jgi:hypothetical protein